MSKVQVRVGREAELPGRKEPVNTLYASAGTVTFTSSSQASIVTKLNFWDEAIDAYERSRKRSWEDTDVRRWRTLAA